jgi:hypothetical protein
VILRYDIQLQTVIKAMVSTIAPAVDPLNALAQEQAQLVIGTLMLMSEQLPLQYRFDLDELTRTVAFADEVAALLEHCGGPVGDAVSALTGSSATGRALLARSSVDPTEIVVAARATRTSLDQVIDLVFTDDCARAYRDDMHRTVLEQSRGEILRDRVWNRSQGFESDSHHLPTVESLLLTSTSAAMTA